MEYMLLASSDCGVFERSLCVCCGVDDCSLVYTLSTGFSDNDSSKLSVINYKKKTFQQIALITKCVYTVDSVLTG